MASLGHIAVGMAAARMAGGRRNPAWPSMAAWSALSMLPDADVIGFGMGVAYGDQWGHRGATHSFAFSAAIGVAIGLAAWRRGRTGVRTGVLAALVLASHAVLDTFTDGGLGCALFWPFDLTRYFAPWNPIPVSPIGVAYLSGYGLMVSITELALFAPLFAFAVWPRGRARAAPIAGLVAAWAAVVWLVWSGDPVRESLIAFVLREDTEIATGFSEQAWRTIRRGQSEDEVRRVLGPPLAEDWDYGFDQTQPCLSVDLARDVVISARDPEACLELGVDVGTARASVRDTLGAPTYACWQYTRAGGNGYYRDRRVCFERGAVRGAFRQWSSGRTR